MVMRAEVRSRWRSWLALVLLVAVVGGIVLGGIAAGRRTASAFPRFVAQYGYDSFAYSYRPLPRLTSLPEVASAVPIESPVNGSPQCSCSHKISEINFGILEYPESGGSRYYKLVSGRQPDPSSPDEVLASFNFARDEGVKAGSEIRVRLYSSSQAHGVISNTASAPQGPTVSLRVVGIEASEPDFPSVGTVSYEVIATPAFARAVNPKAAVFNAYIVRLRHGARDLPRFDADLQALGGAGTSDVGLLKTTVVDAIHPQAVGWWVLALLAAIAGLAVIAQALSRQAGAESDSYRTLSALGFGSNSLIALGIVRAFAIGCTGAVGAMLVAFALSPLAPVGEARIAEPATGLAFDGTVLGLGAVTIGFVVLLLGLWPALRESRRVRGDQKILSTRSSRAVNQLAAAGAPPSMLLGVRRALEGGRGRNAVPVRSALAGAVLAVAALSGTAVFGSQPDAPHHRPQRSTGRSSRSGSTASRRWTRHPVGVVTPPQPSGLRHHPGPPEPRHHRRSGRAHHRRQGDQGSCTRLARERPAARPQRRGGARDEDDEPGRGSRRLRCAHGLPPDVRRQPHVVVPGRGDGFVSARLRRRRAQLGCVRHRGRARGGPLPTGRGLRVVPAELAAEPGAVGWRQARAGRERPGLPAIPAIPRDGLPSRDAGKPRQLRRGGELPPDPRLRARPLRRRHPAPRPGGQRRPATTRGRVAESDRPGPPADRRPCVLAGGHGRAGRHRHRRPPGRGRWPCRLAGVRDQSRRRPGDRDRGRDLGRPRGHGPDRCDRPRHRSGHSCRRGRARRRCSGPNRRTGAGCRKPELRRGGSVPPWRCRRKGAAASPDEQRRPDRRSLRAQGRGARSP